MQYETLRLSVSNNVAVISFSRPEVMNALNTQMRAELLHAVKAAEKSARVLVMTGKGKACGAGQDLGEVGEIIRNTRWAYVLLALLVTALGHWARAARWRMP